MHNSKILRVSNRINLWLLMSLTDWFPVFSFNSLIIKKGFSCKFQNNRFHLLNRWPLQELTHKIWFLSEFLKFELLLKMYSSYYILQHFKQALSNNLDFMSTSYDYKDTQKPVTNQTQLHTLSVASLQYLQYLHQLHNFQSIFLETRFSVHVSMQYASMFFQFYLEYL